MSYIGSRSYNGYLDDNGERRISSYNSTSSRSYCEVFHDYSGASRRKKEHEAIESLTKLIWSHYGGTWEWLHI